jgi:hypothetical protein
VSHSPPILPFLTPNALPPQRDHFLTPKLPPNHAPRFSSAQSTASARVVKSLAGFLTNIEQNPLADLALKDVLGFNMPKIAMTRSLKECFDAATLELSNTFITVCTSLLIPSLVMRPLLSKLSGLPKPFLEIASHQVHADQIETGLEALAKTAKNQKVLQAIDVAKAQWRAASTPEAQHQLLNQIRNARMGATLGFLNAFGFPFWAAAFFRNGLSLAKNKTANFEAMIGLEQSKSSTNKADSSPEAIKAKIKEQFARGGKVLAIGGGISLASALSFGLSARGKGLIDFSKQTANLFFRHWDLKGKGVNQIDKWPTLIYWMAPAYLGWIDAARSKNERFEQSLKGINSTMWFFLFTPLIVNPVSRALFAKTPFAEHFKITEAEYKARRFNKNFFQRLEDDFFTSLKTKGINLGVDKTINIPDFAEIEQKAISNPEFAHLKDAALKWKTSQFGIGLAMTIMFMGIMPQLLNWHLTKRRFALQQQGQLNKEGLDLPQKATNTNNTAVASPNPLNFGTETIPPFWMFEMPLINNAKPLAK